MICGPGNSKSVSYINCYVKTAGRIGENKVEVNFEGVAIKPLNVVNFHIVFNYRYFVYKKFPIDLWEELCGWLNKTRMSWFLDLSLANSMDYIEHDGNKKCPIFGNYSIKMKNVSWETFPMPQMIPSGRYRLDVNVTEANRKNVIVQSMVYFSVSDNRVDQF